MNIKMEIFGQRLKALRNEKHLTQKAMAEFVEKTERHYQAMEAGAINLPSLTLVKLADFFGVGTDYLLGRSDERLGPIPADQIIGGSGVKVLYLPKARAHTEPASPPREPEGKYPCPCCGYLTFPAPQEEAIAYICPVCYWENDVFDPGEDAPSDENRGMTLRQARENFKRRGAVRPEFVKYVRPPKTNEIVKKET